MSHYEGATRDDLIQRIEELENLLDQLRREQIEDERLDYAWTGNLGHWYWNCQTNTVTFNPLKITALGYDREEVPASCTYQYFTDMLHPDDYDVAMEAMRAHLSGRNPVYEVEYRIRAKDGAWRWYYDRGRITKRDDAGQPLLLAGIVFDISDRKAIQQRLEEQNRILEALATVDELTNVLNRRTLYGRLEQELLRARRYGLRLSITMFDIDHFKQINDRHGHLTGDMVLVQLAAAIQHVIRVVDFVGRYGGEEFMVVSPMTSLEQARVIAERIREVARQLTFAQGVRVTISGGVKEYAGETIDELVDSVDRLLYRAKAHGRDRIEWSLDIVD